MARRNHAEVVVADEIGVYHCVHCVKRVVRRAFLCGVDALSGKSYDHRRAWVRDRLESLAGLFGVAIAAIAVMSNHLHVILRNRPDEVALWSDSEVARRLLALFPDRVATQTDPPSAPPYCDNSPGGRSDRGQVKILRHAFSPKPSENSPACREEPRSDAPPTPGPGSSAVVVISEAI